jgi:hypothetical protein
MASETADVPGVKFKDLLYTSKIMSLQDLAWTRI